MIKKFLITLVVIISILAVALIGFYIAARTKLGIDLFDTVRQLKTIGKTVDEEQSFPVAFDSQDIEELKSQTDSQLLENVIFYEEGKGYEGYSVDFEKLALAGATASPMTLTEQMTGALAEIVFYQQTNGTLKISGNDIPVRVLQVAFDNIDSATGNADLATTVKIDMSPFKDGMGSFPYNLLKKYVPDFLYVTSVVRIEKGAGLAYTVTSQYLLLNSMSDEDTSDFFHTLDVVLGIGTAEGLNLKIGTTAANALIGNSESPGFVYALRATAGSGDFRFVSVVISEKQTDILAF